MRDWEVMHRVMDECYYRRVPVDFDIVTKECFYSKFTGCMNATFHSNISERALVELYRDADTSCPRCFCDGVQFYFGSTRMWHSRHFHSDRRHSRLCQQRMWVAAPERERRGSFESHRILCTNRKIAVSRPEAARLQALQFDWCKVAEQMHFVYSAVVAGRPLIHHT